MTLHLRLWPQRDSPAGRITPEEATQLVLLHGFTQNVECWGRFGQELAHKVSVAAIDAPGHGLTDSAHDRANLWQAADLINSSLGPGAATAAGAEIGVPDLPVVVGYSMGGRLALHLALKHPEAVSGLALIGATPGIVDDGDRAERLRSDNDLAARIRKDPLDEFLDRWLAQPLFAGLDVAAAARSARLENRREGLANSLECCGTGAQDLLWGRLNEINMPVLLITGSRDAKFGALAKQMATALVNADVTSVEVEGTHAVHLERPVESADVILSWLETIR